MKPTAKPFIKWAGGKSQLLSKFQTVYPFELKKQTIKHYYEPFLGSGAVFFDIAQNYSIKSAYLYDANEELILTYKVVQKDVHRLLEFLERYEKEFLKLNKRDRKSYYYTQRQNYNLQRFNIDYKRYSENWVPRAAQFIFLNKTCFNGLFRVNSKGEFNSPIGEYENPKICDANNILAVHEILQIAEIKIADFQEVQKDLKPNSFVYFDPPYRPISKTSYFQSYNTKSFDDEAQIQLAHTFKAIHKKGAKLMLSNSDPKNTNPNDSFFDDIYKGFYITRIPARRMINSVASKRGEINEILVTNYPIPI